MLAIAVYLIGTLIAVIYISDAVTYTSLEWEEAICEVTGARKVCTSLECTAWVCWFGYQSTCDGASVAGEMKRTSFQYNGIGHLKTDADCLQSVGMAVDAMGSTQCWRRADSCTIFSYDPPDEMARRVDIIHLVGMIIGMLGIFIFILDRLLCRGQRGDPDCDCDCC